MLDPRDVEIIHGLLNGFIFIGFVGMTIMGFALLYYGWRFLFRLIKD